MQPCWVGTDVDSVDVIALVCLLLGHSCAGKEPERSFFGGVDIIALASCYLTPVICFFKVLDIKLREITKKLNIFIYIILAGGGRLNDLMV